MDIAKNKLIQKKMSKYAKYWVDVVYKFCIIKIQKYFRWLMMPEYKVLFKIGVGHSAEKKPVTSKIHACQNLKCLKKYSANMWRNLK